jgi:hypothetical protein
MFLRSLLRLRRLIMRIEHIIVRRSCFFTLLLRLLDLRLSLLRYRMVLSCLGRSLRLEGHCQINLLHWRSHRITSWVRRKEPLPVLSKLDLALLEELLLVLCTERVTIPDTYLGTPLYAMLANGLRLIATMVFEIGAFSIAGLMALYFHQQNKKADTEGIVLEGQPGFRYTT